MSCRPHHLTRQPVCFQCNPLPEDCNPSSVHPFLNTAAMVEEKIAAPLPQQQLLGDPRWPGTVQTRGWPTVCGSNRQTFPNTCFLHVRNCFSATYVDLRPAEYCEGESGVSQRVDSKKIWHKLDQARSKPFRNPLSTKLETFSSIKL